MYINNVIGPSGKKVKIGRFGRISVYIHRNKYRIRFQYLKKQYSLTVGDICDETWNIAAAKAQEINSDIIFSRFDETLAKYSPKHAKALQILEKKDVLNLRQVWENYKKIKDQMVQPSTKKHCWSQVDRCLDSINTDLLSLDKSLQFLAALLNAYAVGTVRPVLADLNAAANLAVKMKLIEENNYRHLELPRKIKKPIEAYDDDEIKAILEAFHNDLILQ